MEMHVYSTATMEYAEFLKTCFAILYRMRHRNGGLLEPRKSWDNLEDAVLKK
jgi:hypothetical protein